MEPRPQRPRSAPGQGHHPSGPQANRPATPPPGNSGPPAEGYGDDYDDQTYIAPARTEYDYSPLDLAPPGQRRRRQFVAAAIGALAVVMILAIAVLAYLLLGDNDNEPDVDVAALQTQNAESNATNAAQGTRIADAGAAQTATAGGEAVTTAQPTTEADSTEASGDTEPTTEGETPEPTTEGEPTEAASDATSEATDGAASGAGEDTGTAGPDVAALKAMLPGADAIPAALDTEDDSGLDQASVVTALGGSRTVEQNLERWGWSGNAGRTWSAADPEALEAGATSNLSVSIHGFKDVASAGKAATFYSDVLASQEGYEEGTAPELGENARILTLTDENGGIVVALYVQQGNVLYRFGGYAPSGGDPTDDVIALATAAIPAGE